MYICMCIRCQRPGTKDVNLYGFVASVAPDLKLMWSTDLCQNISGAFRASSCCSRVGGAVEAEVVTLLVLFFLLPGPGRETPKSGPGWPELCSPGPAKPLHCHRRRIVGAPPRRC